VDNIIITAEIGQARAFMLLAMLCILLYPTADTGGVFIPDSNGYNPEQPYCIMGMPYRMASSLICDLKNNRTMDTTSRSFNTTSA